MKKLVYCIAALTVVFSCSSPLEPVGPDDGGGNQSSLSIQCITGDATELTSTTAKLSGTCTIKNAKAANGQAIFYYSSNNGKPEEIKTGGNKSETSSVAAEGGSFSVTLSNLTPSTKYYYVAAVSIDGKEVFGSVKSFTSAEKPKDPTVTGAATNITEWSATLSAYANPTTDMGTVTMGVLYSKNENPTLDNGQKLTSKELDGNNMYTVKASNLSSNTTYYFKSILEYGGVIRSGEVKSFTTKEIKAEINTSDASGVGLHKAVLNGQVTVNSTESLSRTAWFLYSDKESTIEGLKTSGKKVAVSINNDGSFSNSLEDLSDNTTYYYIAVAQVHDVILYGDLKSFTTDEVNTTVSVTTNPATNIGFYKATLNGHLSINSNESINNKNAWFLISRVESTLDGLKRGGGVVQVSINTDGSFSYNENVNHNTKYYYVACAKVNDNDYYGSVESFETLKYEDYVSLAVEASNVDVTSVTLKTKITNNDQQTLNTATPIFVISSTESTVEGLYGNGSKIGVQNTDSDGFFSTTRSNLQPETKYYYMAYTSIEGYNIYSEVQSFETAKLEDAVSLITEDATDIKCLSATLNGRITINSSDLKLQSLQFLISETESSVEGLIASGRTVSYKSYNEDGTFTGLTGVEKYSTTCYYVAAAKINNQMFYGSTVKSFTTLYPEFQVKTLEPTNLKKGSAVLNAEVQCDNEIAPYLIGYVAYIEKADASLEELLTKSKKYYVGAVNDTSFPFDNLDIGAPYSYAFYFTLHISNNEDVTVYGNVVSFTSWDHTYSEPTAVDMGLSVKWPWWTQLNGAIMYYPFAWGETWIKPDDHYSWTSWKYYYWCNQTSNSLTRYCPSDKTDYWGGEGNPDNKMKLSDYNYVDDAARTKLGGKWRIPTKAEWEELLDENNCTWKWENDHYKVTSKKTGKFIYVYATESDKKSGRYWASDIVPNTPSCAYYLVFDSQEKILKISSTVRSVGFRILPVLDY